MSEISKSQQKKLRKKEHWLEKKKEKKAKKKEKKTKKPKIFSLFKTNFLEWENRLKSGIKVVVDCDFDSYQTEKELTSLKQQLIYCYAENKRSDHPLNLELCGVSSQMQESLQKVSYSNWSLSVRNETYLNLFDKDKLVYLTADSETNLDTFDPESIYIIGGIVDHNRHKMLTYNKANSESIKTARLPLNKYVQLQRSSVLAVNHMVALILKYGETQDWTLAINEAIPQRKIAKIVN